MKFQIQNFESGQIDALINRVENNASQIDEVVAKITKNYDSGLDRYVAFVKDCLDDGEKRPTTIELEDWCMNMSAELYFAYSGCERLGVRDDIAKAMYKEAYNASRNAVDKGTVADKDSIATLQSQEEAIVSSAYTRAYKAMKGKVEAGQEVLASCKKVLQNRITERELTHLQGQ